MSKIVEPTSLEAQITVSSLRRILKALEREPREHLERAFAEAGCEYGQLLQCPEAFANIDLFSLLQPLNQPQYFPGIVLRYARQREILDLGVLGFTILSCSDIRQAMLVTSRYHGLTAEAYRTGLQFEADRACFRQWIRPGYFDSRVEIDEEHIAGVWQLLKTLLPQSLSMAEVEIQLGFPEPPYGDLYREVFTCPISFARESTSISFPAAWLDLPLQTADEMVERACQAQCESMLDKLGRGSGLVEEVRRLLLSVPGNRSVRLEEVARAVMLSERSLERRLLEAGTSFRSIDNEVRMGLAEEYIRLRYLPDKEIAYLLNYSQPGTFYRAFKNWFGITPKAFRKTVADDGGKGPRQAPDQNSGAETRPRPGVER
jgi:AraC-like DNA-binding protein